MTRSITVTWVERPPEIQKDRGADDKPHRQGNQQEPGDPFPKAEARERADDSTSGNEEYQPGENAIRRRARLIGPQQGKDEHERRPQLEDDEQNVKEPHLTSIFNSDGQIWRHIWMYRGPDVNP